MSKQPYENLASQAERRATLRNEQRVRASTYVDHVHDDLSGGRFAKEFPTEKLGVTPVPQYPKGANWSQDQLPMKRRLAWRSMRWSRSASRTK